jgi:uncharacterized protein (DUF2252 family)
MSAGQRGPEIDIAITNDLQPASALLAFQHPFQSASGCYRHHAMRVPQTSNQQVLDWNPSLTGTTGMIKVTGSDIQKAVALSQRDLAHLVLISRSVVGLYPSAHPVLNARKRGAKVMPS